VDGLSPYLAYIERNAIPIPEKNRIQSVDIENKSVMTDLYEIRYERLVSTLNLSTFLHLASIEVELAFQSAGAKLALFKSSEEVAPNRAVYDCDPGRQFTALSRRTSI